MSSTVLTPAEPMAETFYRAPAASRDERAAREQGRYRQRKEYTAYLALIFPFSLIVVLLSEVARVFFTGLSVRKPGQGILSSAVELSQTTVPWIFMVR